MGELWVEAGGVRLHLRAWGEPSGQPVLFLADHPITGGYPVIAVVVDADIDAAAQLRPGQRLRFVSVADP